MPPAQPGAAGGRPPRPPPRPRGALTPENIAALAKREQVPARIARGELEGKMLARIWKKLHPTKAKRFQEAWTLMEANPGVELAYAMESVDGNLPLKEVIARHARVTLKRDVKAARSAVSPDEVDAFVASLIERQAECTVVLSERTFSDVATKVEPVFLEFARSGRMEKLHICVLSEVESWKRLGDAAERDVALMRNPTHVARQPNKRPVSDARPLLPLVGTVVGLELRNGLRFKLPLQKVGPYDVIVGDEVSKLLVPLHALLSWTPTA